jgi:hypothetical protein
MARLVFVVYVSSVNTYDLTPLQGEGLMTRYDTLQ